MDLLLTGDMSFDYCLPVGCYTGSVGGWQNAPGVQLIKMFVNGVKESSAGLSAVICTTAGCNNPQACNFNQFADVNNGSCTFPGCLNAAACNYNPSAGCGNSALCTFPGCTNPAATNYNPTAACDDGSCIIPGCLDDNACNFGNGATVHDGTLCTYPGCTNPAATNYNPAPGCDNSSCIVPGCLDDNACNFDSGATVHDGSLCQYPGCMDETACNYNPTAVCDFGSCIYGNNEFLFNVYQLDFATTVTVAVYDSQGGILLDEYTTFLFGNFIFQVCANSSCPWVEISGISGPSGYVEVYFLGVTNNFLTLTTSGYACPPGCTDDNACNFESFALVDNGSCEYTSCLCPSDFDGNDVVNTSDLLLFMSQFGCSSSCGVFDLDGNGVVNTSDLLLFMAVFGTAC